MNYKEIFGEGLSVKLSEVLDDESYRKARAVMLDFLDKHLTVLNFEQVWHISEEHVFNNPIEMHDRARYSAKYALAESLQKYWFEQSVPYPMERGLRFSIIVIGPKK